MSWPSRRPRLPLCEWLPSDMASRSSPPHGPIALSRRHAGQPTPGQPRNPATPWLAGLHPANSATSASLLPDAVMGEVPRMARNGGCGSTHRSIRAHEVTEIVTLTPPTGLPTCCGARPHQSTWRCRTWSRLRGKSPPAPPSPRCKLTDCGERYRLRSHPARFISRSLLTTGMWGDVLPSDSASQSSLVASSTPRQPRPRRHGI